jgi:hypothetical protein
MRSKVPDEGVIRIDHAPSLSGGVTPGRAPVLN